MRRQEDDRKYLIKSHTISLMEKNVQFDYFCSEPTTKFGSNVSTASIPDRAVVRVEVAPKRVAAEQLEAF
jgi:hypothetical protein